jgi:chromate reductase
MNLVSLVASTRDGSVNRALYSGVSDTLAGQGHVLDEIDYRLVEDLLPYTPRREAEGLPDAVREKADRIRAADGLVIATPEYNFSMPGSLKNAFDWLSRIKPYPTMDKPVLLMAASGSPLGGWRGLNALRVTLGCLGARATPWEITAGSVTSPDAVVALLQTEAFKARVDNVIAQFG